MLDSIEKFRQINVRCKAVTAPDRPAYLLGCSVSGATRSKPVTRIAEVRVEHGRENLDDGLLDQAVDNVWDTKQPFAAIGLVDGLASHRIGAIRAIEQLLSNRRPAGSKPVGEVRDRDSVRPGSPTVSFHVLPG